jgi:hypothetical protein
MATYNISIQGTTIEIDRGALLDFKIALSDYHGRLAAVVHGASDMKIATAAAHLLIDAQEAYDAFPETLKD